MKNILTILSLVIFTAGCVSTKNEDVMLDQKIDAPKVIAMSGSRGPWIYEIEKRIKKNGFKIKRMTSQKSSIEDVSETKTELYREASARFILHIDGYAPNNSMERCFGGGYKFSHINAELIDVTNNETVLHYSNSGYSEGCQPLSGTIFGDIADLVNSAWK